MLSDNSLSLSGLIHEKESLYRLIELKKGEVSDEDERLLADNYNRFINKTDFIVEAYQYLMEQIEGAKSKKDELTKFIKVRQDAIERLKDHIDNCMAKENTNSFRGEFFEIKKRKPSKVLKIEDEDKIPAEFLAVKTSVIKRKLIDAIKQGVEVEGVSIVDGERSIQFRAKSISKRGRPDEIE